MELFLEIFHVASGLYWRTKDHLYRDCRFLKEKTVLRVLVPQNEIAYYDFCDGCVERGWPDYKTFGEPQGTWTHVGCGGNIVDEKCSKCGTSTMAGALLG